MAGAVATVVPMLAMVQEFQLHWKSANKVLYICICVYVYVYVYVYNFCVPLTSHGFLCVSVGFSGSYAYASYASAYASYAS